MENPITAESKHFDPLLVVRALACFAVIWAHSYAGKLILFGNDFSFIYPSGEAAVFIFYLLSGYGIGASFVSGKYRLTPSSLIKFFINRFLRIAPLYFFVLLTCIFFLYREFQIPINPWIRLFTFTATNPNIIPRLFPLTIVSTEMQFYIIAPILFFILKVACKRIPIWFLAGLIFILGALARFILISHSGGQELIFYTTTIYTSVYGNIDIFLFGMLIAIVSSIERIQKKRTTFLYIIKKFYPFFILLWYYWASFLTYNLGDLYKYEHVKYQILFLLPPITSSLIGLYIFFVASKSKSLTFPKPKEITGLMFSSRRFLFGLGTLSYGMYLWHYPVMDYLFYRRYAEFSFQGACYRFFVVFILSLIFSFITYLCIELPFYKLRFILKTSRRK